MGIRTWIVAGLVGVVAAAGIATAAQGSSGSTTKMWHFNAALGKTAVPHLAGTSRLVVDATNFTANQIDNPPSGTSQGDELVVAAQLLTPDGNPTGQLEVHEVLTQVLSPRAQMLQLTATVRLPGGSISAVGVQQSNQPGTKLAVVGGTGQYYNVRGGQLTAASSNGKARLTFLLLRN